MISTNSDFKKENRIRLFGHEDAGKEKDARLSEYYFKTTQYEDISSDIGLQIVVGEKGTGKSALLKMAYLILAFDNVPKSFSKRERWHILFPHLVLLKGLLKNFRLNTERG